MYLVVTNGTQDVETEGIEKVEGRGTHKKGMRLWSSFKEGRTKMSGFI